MITVGLDTEFMEHDGAIHLISLGMAAETGQRLYGVAADFDRRLITISAASADPFVARRVWPLLPLTNCPASCGCGVAHPDPTHPAVAPRAVLADRAARWLADVSGGHGVDLWTVYGSYDMVALTQMWGAACSPSRPLELPWDCGDAARQARLMGLHLPPRTGTAHNALTDAVYALDAALLLRQQVPSATR